MKSKRSVSNIKYIIGIDEVGRGPIAGPVTLCAFCIPKECRYRVMTLFKGGKIKDSKKLKAKNREEIFAKVLSEQKKFGLEYAVTFASSRLIDTKGLSYAIKNCLKICLQKLNKRPEDCLVLLDGGLKASIEYTNQQTIIKGDEKEVAIALASIMAKVSRDRKMTLFAKKYPDYGFEIHKGYGTKNHYSNLKKNGPSDIHRRSFLGLK